MSMVQFYKYCNFIEDCDVSAYSILKLLMINIKNYIMNYHTI